MRYIIASLALALGVSAVAFAQQGPFSDVSSLHLHATAIAYVKNEGIVSGYPDGTFRPDTTVNRAEFTKIIVEALGGVPQVMCRIAPFPDSEAGAWYADYLQYARCSGVVSGYPDGTFKPSNTINVAEAAKIIVEAYGYESTETSTWYEGYIEALTDRNALPSDVRSVSDMLTRGAMAEIIYRLQTGTNDEPVSILDSDSEEEDTGLLPLGDGLYSNSPKMGYTYSCQTTFGGGGAFREGEWIQGDWWDPTQKPSVDGSNLWDSAQFTIVDGTTTRTIISNGYPVNTPTGNFPVSSSDDAYDYDRNPNSIQQQNITLSLPINPTLASSPSCVPMGLIGVSLNGVAIFNGFDAAGRDAAAHEILDNCNGHPQQQGMYHYHAGSDCVEEPNSGGQSPLFGYALDGFGIYGKYDENGRELTSSDLDECHGRTSMVEWNGTMQEIYHYVLTDDYPYTIACFKGTPVNTGGLGNDAMGQTGEQQTGPANGPPPEAISACNGKTYGSCYFTGPRGTVNGTCRETPEGVVACVP